MKSSANLIDEQDYPVERSYVLEVARHVGSIRQVLKWFNAVSAVATKKQIEDLRSLTFVREIELVGRWKKKPQSKQFSPVKPDRNLKTTNSTASFDYGPSFAQLSQMNVPAVHNLGIYGQGIVICMFDDGVRMLSHEAFDSMNIVAMHDFVDHKESVVPNDPGAGYHGTATLSVIGGYRPGSLIGPAFKASYLLARTENDSSETPIEEDNWAAAIQWADSIGVDVTSTSLVYLAFDPGYASLTWQDMNGHTALITNAADRAVSLGITVVNAAGNNGSGDGTHNTLWAPADGDSVITAGAVDVSGARAGFSSIGPTTDNPPRIKPDVMAMGVNVILADGSNSTAFGAGSGTSFACPLSAGVAALIRCANPALTPIQVREAMRQTASQSNTPDNFMGWGILDALRAVDYFGVLPLGKIRGLVFNDLNRNGVQDFGEEGVPGVVIHCYGAKSESTITDNSGRYLLDSLPIGSFAIRESISAGYIQSAPGSEFDTVSILFRADTSGFNFGIAKLSSYTSSVDQGWNLLSLPCRTLDSLEGTLYPHAISRAFFYDGMYVAGDILHHGEGYWLKFDSARALTIPGDTLLQDTISVNRGWNMVGSLTLPVPVSTITSLPPGMITSGFFGYAENQYTLSDTIRDGHGYWVKVREDGRLVLSAVGGTPGPERIQIVASTNESPPSPPTGTEMDHRTSTIPAQFSLGQNYPNPFNPKTIVNFHLASSSFVMLKVFDVLGREVATLVSEFMKPGSYGVSWDAGGKPSGVYFYRLQAGNFIETRKMLILE